MRLRGTREQLMVVVLTFLPVGLPSAALVLEARRQPKGVQGAHCADNRLHHRHIRVLARSERPRPTNNMSSTLKTHVIGLKWTYPGKSTCHAAP